MENATKALLMAAEILVGVLLLSLIASLFVIFADYRAEIQRNENARLVHEFNTQFENYSGITLHPQDVLTISNLVNDYNGKMQSVAITLRVEGGISNIRNNSQFLDANKTYKINKMEYNAEGEVNLIEIIKEN